MGKSDSQGRSRPRPFGITQIAVSGYKSIIQEQAIEIRPLTILAGANSSGKSSIMQPLLLLKQTLEASYDPGALLLNGPNVRFTSVDQVLARTKIAQTNFRVAIKIGADLRLELCFERQSNKKGFAIQSSTIVDRDGKRTLRMEMTSKEIEANIPLEVKRLVEDLSAPDEAGVEWTIIRNRCFLEPTVRMITGKVRRILTPPPNRSMNTFDSNIRRVIHLPGLRGNPERTYPVTAVGPTFPGTFEKYTASVIAQWQANKHNDNLKRLGTDLERLGLACKVSARPIDDTQVELRVGRLLHSVKGGAADMVSIADVGFGVSQTLPVLVAIHTAAPGQVVYLEQPEIHLHPRAQFTMGQLLADAANRNVRLVVETHSDLLLLGVQTAVAERNLPPELVKLHWFQRDDNGMTKVDSADLDASGSFGNWSEDFGKTALEAESRYLDAAEASHLRTN
jgi:hypothetical protein